MTSWYTNDASRFELKFYICYDKAIAKAVTLPENMHPFSMKPNGSLITDLIQVDAVSVNRDTSKLIASNDLIGLSST